MEERVDSRLSASRATFYVSPDGNDSYPGTMDLPLLTLAWPASRLTLTVRTPTARHSDHAVGLKLEMGRPFQIQSDL